MINKNKLINIITIILFQASSLFILIGITISSIFIINSPENLLGQILPITIFSFISLVLKSIYIYLISKEYLLIKVHLKKNWIIYDFISIIINIFNIIFALFFITIFANLGLWNISENKYFVILLIALTFSISLISVGFHQYFMYKVKIDLEKRKNGE